MGPSGCLQSWKVIRRLVSHGNFGPTFLDALSPFPARNTAVFPLLRDRSEWGIICSSSEISSDRQVRYVHLDFEHCWPQRLGSSDIIILGAWTGVKHLSQVRRPADVFTQSFASANSTHVDEFVLRTWGRAFSWGHRYYVSWHLW